MRLYAAGSNARGQLGSADCDDSHTFRPAHFGSDSLPTTILDLTCGANHTLVLVAHHRPELWGCGDSTRGQLLSGSTHVFRPIPLDICLCGLDGYTISGIAACWETSFVILTPATSSPTDHASGEKSDVILSFGANDFGDRGVGPSPSADESTIVDFRDLAFPEISAPHLIRVREMATGPHHVVASLDVWPARDAEPVSVLVGWGASRHGQLGAAPAAPVVKSRSASRPGSHRTQIVDKPIIIAVYRDEESRPRHLAAGSQHTLVLHNSGRITTLGSSRRGQLDIPTNDNIRAQQIGCTWTASFVVSGDPESWRIDACGSSNHGQLGRGDSASPGSVVLPTPSTCFRQLACGSEHVLVLIGDEVWAWGWNEHGNLGLGHTEDVLAPVRVWPRGQDQGRVVQIWAGCGTSWVLVEPKNNIE